MAATSSVKVVDLLIHMEVVLKWLQYGSLCFGSCYSTGLYTIFRHVGHSNLGLLRCPKLSSAFLLVRGLRVGNCPGEGYTVVTKKMNMKAGGLAQVAFTVG